MFAQLYSLYNLISNEYHNLGERKKTVSYKDKLNVYVMLDLKFHREQDISTFLMKENLV